MCEKLKGVLMQDLQYIISYEDENIGSFSNLHLCTFKNSEKVFRFSIIAAQRKMQSRTQNYIALNNSQDVFISAFIELDFKITHQ